MDPETRRGVEAILMVAEDPVHPHLLAQLVDVEPPELDEVIRELDEAYTAEGRGFIIAKVAGGYRFQSHPDAAPYVERFVLEGQTARLSSAALETLAIVAYKQPISRAQVASIRGVSVDGVVRTLEQRGYIAEVARDPGPGNAVLFGTTPLFLEKLGLDSVADLPPIAQFVPDAGIVEQLEHGLRTERPEPAPAGDDDGDDRASEREADDGASPAPTAASAPPDNAPTTDVVDVIEADAEPAGPSEPAASATDPDAGSAATVADEAAGRGDGDPAHGGLVDGDPAEGGPVLDGSLSVETPSPDLRAGDDGPDLAGPGPS